MTWPLLRLRLLPAFLLLELTVAARPAIEAFEFRQYEGGPGWTLGFEPEAGTPVCFDFRVGSLKAQEGDFDDELRYEASMEGLDSDGKAWAPPIARKNIATVTPEDKKTGWKPKEQACLTLPSLLAASNFRIRVTVNDLLAEETISADFPFRVRGPTIPPGAPLALSNLRFQRGETDPQPLAVAAYRAGDTVWVRFEIIGFQLSGGRVSLEYGLTVTSPTGKVLYDNPSAVSEERKFEYPPAYLPGVANLTIQPGTRPGAYGLRIRLSDRIANRRVEFVTEFRVE